MARARLRERGPTNKGNTMAEKTKGVERPLSPHALIVSTLLVVWWLIAAATSEAYFDLANGILTSWIGDIVMTLSLLGVWYHFLAGLRHLYYDAGKGLDIPTAEKLGWACLIGSVVLTVLTIVII